MKTTFLTFVGIGMIAAATAYADAPAGAEITGCDVNAFTPVMAADGSVAYWNVRNDLCPKAQGQVESNREDAERLAEKAE